MGALWKEPVLQILETAGVRASVTVFDPVSKETLQVRDEEQLLSASLIKLPVLWELFARAEAGDLSLAEEIVLDRSHRVDGGLLHKFSQEPRLRLEDYALLMGALSDNSAANTLIDRLGMDAVNDRARELGMASTRLERKMLDSAARKAGKDNYTSAADVALFFQKLLEGPGLSQISRSRILDILSAQKLQSKLAGQIPCDDVDDLEKILAHKTGELAGYEHDAGILFPFGPRPLIVAVLTQGLEDRLDGVKLCAQIGRILYDAQKTLQG